LPMSFDWEEARDPILDVQRSDRWQPN